MIYKTVSNSSADTVSLGAKIGRQLKGGEVIELTSDLGGGKTTLVRGLAEGLGYKGQITSPTFTISRVYPLPNDLELHHFDFYRLGAGDIVSTELAEVAGHPEVVAVVEWAGNYGDTLPHLSLKINIEVLGDAERKIEVLSVDPQYRKIIEQLNDSGD